MQSEQKEQVRINQIVVKNQIQQRVKLNEDCIEEYAEAIGSGAKLPPIVLFDDGENLLLVDGRHRYEANLKAGVETIEATIYEGSEREAILYAVGANADHGLRRNNADKRMAVTTLLTDSEWGKWSDTEIARRCLVSQPFVSNVRRELTQNGFEWGPTRKGADGREINTSNIGAKPKTGEIENSSNVEESESPQTEIESVENTEEDQVQTSEEGEAERSADTDSVIGSEIDKSSVMGSPEDGQNSIKGSSDIGREKTSMTDEPIGPFLEDLKSSSAETGSFSKEDETKSPKPESIEDQADELSDINDVATLKAKIVELQNTIKEKDQQLQQKEELIIGLKQKVNGLKDTIKYYEEEIIDSLNRDSGYSSSMPKGPNYKTMLSE